MMSADDGRPSLGSAKPGAYGERRSNAETARGPGDRYVAPREHQLGHANIEDVVVGFLALKALGTMADAFTARLGERMADSAADVLKKVRLRRGRRDRLEIETGGAPTTIVLGRELSDEARLALIDLDVTADGVRGKTLAWDEAHRAWRPSDSDELTVPDWLT